MSRKTTLTTLTLLGLLLASLSVNLFLLKRLGSSFASIHSARVFPLGEDISVYEKYSTNIPDEKICFAVFGDSRAYHWTPILRSKLKIDVKNFAAGGRTTEQQLVLIDRISEQQFKYSLIQIGINDLHPLGAFPEATKQVARDNVQSNILSIIKRLKERSDIVIVSTVFLPGPVPLSRKPFWDGNTLAEVIRLNDVLRQLDGVVVLDSEQIVHGTDEDGYLESVHVDPDFFLHVSSDFYETIVEDLARRVSPSC